MTGSLFFPLESLSFNTISTTKRLPESPGELFFPDLWSEAFFLFWCPSLPSTLRRKHIFAALPCCTFAGRTSPSSHPLSLNWLPIKDSILSDSARENGPWEASAFSYRISLSRAQQFKNPKNPSAVTVDQWTIPCFREPRFRVPPEDTETILRHQGPGSSPDLCNHFDLVPVSRGCKHVVLRFVNSGHWDLQEKWRTTEQTGAWNPQQNLIVASVTDKEVKCCPWPGKERKKEWGLEEEREGRKREGRTLCGPWEIAFFEQHPKGRHQTGVNGSEGMVLFSLSTAKPAPFSLQKLVSRL